MKTGLLAAKEGFVETKLTEGNPLLFFENNDQALLRKKLRSHVSNQSQTSQAAILEQEASDQTGLSKLNLEATRSRFSILKIT